MRTTRCLLASVASLSLGLGACSTIVSGTSETVNIDTPGVPLANCQLLTKTGPVSVQTPTQISLPKRDADIPVVCNKPGHEEGRGLIHSGFEAWTLGNLLIGGLVGFTIDFVSGAWNNYDDKVAIVLKPRPQPSNQPFPGQAPSAPMAALPPPMPGVPGARTSSMAPMPQMPMASGPLPEVPAGAMAQGTPLPAPARTSADAARAVALEAAMAKTRAALAATAQAERVTASLASRSNVPATGNPASERAFLRQGSSLTGPTDAGAFGVQVASFLDRAQAEQGWQQLAARMPDLVQGRQMIVREALIGGRTYYRLYAGSSTRTDATNLCQQIRARNVNCIVSAI